MTTFSIITCTCNSEPFIERCIDSVRAQDYRGGVQHVFVDGGSDDGTLERIQSLTGNVVWQTGVRAGIAQAMNVGVAVADGDVIAHLHGDDYFLGPSVLAAVATALERSRAPWLFGRIVSDIAGKQVPPDWPMPSFSRKRLLRGNFIAHPAVFMRRDFFEALGGFDVDLKYAMDYDLWLRATSKADPVYLDAYLAAFRRHEGSASTADAAAAFAEDHQVRRRYIGANPFVRAWHEGIHLWRRRQRHLP